MKTPIIELDILIQRLEHFSSDIQATVLAFKEIAKGIKADNQVDTMRAKAPKQ